VQLGPALPCRARASAGRSLKTEERT
jgi:hypothetical protein